MSQPITREQFAARVVEIVRSRFPLVEVSEGNGHFALLINGAMAPLENLYRAATIRPGEMQRHVERWAVELLRASEGTPEDEGSFEDVKERILPMVLPSGAPESQRGIVFQKLIPGLIVAYAIDHDRTIAYLPRQRFEEWHITHDELHEAAITNLTARSDSIPAHAAQDDKGRTNLIIFQTMDGYDASRLLLPSLHDRLKQHLGTPFCAGLPNRDILLCFRNDDETVARLHAQIKDDYQRMPHQITDRLVLVTADGIAPRS